jgi:hypothetical protein
MAFEDGWMNLVLMIGGQLLILILVAMILTFGVDSTFPSNIAQRFFAA